MCIILFLIVSYCNICRVLYPPTTLLYPSGDVFLDIAELESRILLKLTEAVLREAGTLEAGVSLVAQLDCLLAMATVSLENGWTRPQLAVDGPLGKPWVKDKTDDSARLSFFICVLVCSSRVYILPDLFSLVPKVLY